MANELVVTLGPGATQPRRLLDTISRVPMPDGPPRWLEGLKWEPWPCRALTVDAEDACTADTLDVVPATCETFIAQAPFRISDAMQYSTLDTTAEEMDDRLALRYNTQISAAFATELLSGTASAGISLSSEATAPNGAAFGDPYSVSFGLSVLEQEIAERLRGGVGFIHVPPGMLSSLVEKCGLRLNSNGVWETPVGNLVISDAGYINPPPPTGEVASTEWSDWMYASGPVWFESTSPTLVGANSERFVAGEGRGTTAFDRNTYRQYIAGYGILVFNPCPVTAVLIGYNEVGEAWAS